MASSGTEESKSSALDVALCAMGEGASLTSTGAKFYEDTLVAWKQKRTLELVVF